jgi:hypothetical protein
MKDARNQNIKQSKEPAINNNKPRPENKDNLDSRDNLELNDANEGGGHNKKELHIGVKDEHNEKRGDRPDK